MLFDQITQEQEAMTATRPETEIGMGFAFDWQTQHLKMQDGTPVLVYGVAAIKEWVQLVAHTRQGRYPIYPADFGAPVQDLAGQKAPKGYDLSELRRHLAESAAYNPGIRDVGQMRYDGEKVLCTLTLEDNDEGITEVIQIVP
ncbi:MAG: DUF2634 domain-containing protein [Firmicutes bacterium]|nr:DUF2634 domain-containing protein [Bacillota bacterium]